MRKPVLILQQLECEPAALIRETIHAGGIESRVVMTQAESVPLALTPYSGLVVMGGPMSANDTHLDFISRQIRLLQWCVRHDFPVLGICLGAQLLARAAGAEIIPSPLRELGWYPLYPACPARDDPLFGGLQATGLYVFQWHGETFTLPENTTLLATCPDVTNQVFRLGSCQYGLQFHTEVDEHLIREWIKVGAGEREHLGEAGVGALLHESPEHLAVARKFCRRMVHAWLEFL